LPQLRRAAAVQGRQHHDRVPDQASVRSPRRGGARGQARPRRPRAQRNPRDHRGIPARARLVRGAVVVKAAAFAVPGDLATPTGGYAYDRRIIARLAAPGRRRDVVDLGEGFPRPSPRTLGTARTLLARVPEHRTIVVDGLAFGVIPELAAELSRAHPLLALMHHPLALESGLSDADARMFRCREIAALARA